MKTFTQLTILCLLLFFGGAAPAQTPPVITVASEDSIWLNKVALTSAISEDQVITELGKPSRIKDKPAEKYYYYDELGLLIAFQKGKLALIGVNFNWDGDKNFPEKSYTGKLVIGNTEITKATTREDFEKLTAIKVSCPVPIICATVDKDAKVKALVGFEKNVTQVSFMLK